MSAPTEPLVSLGQGTSQRNITEEDVSKDRHGLSIGKLVCLWLAFAVLAWLYSLAKEGRP